MEGGVKGLDISIGSGASGNIDSGALTVLFILVMLLAISGSEE